MFVVICCHLRRSLSVIDIADDGTWEDLAFFSGVCDLGAL